MNLSNSNLKLSDLQKGTWYYIKANSQYSNEITAVKNENNQVHIRYIGGDFKEPFSFTFIWTQEALNKGWQYAFPEEHEHPGDATLDATLSLLEEESVLFYHLLNDLSYDNVDAFAQELPKIEEV